MCAPSAGGLLEDRRARSFRYPRSMKLRHASLVVALVSVVACADGTDIEGGGGGDEGVGAQGVGGDPSSATTTTTTTTTTTSTGGEGGAGGMGEGGAGEGGAGEGGSNGSGGNSCDYTAPNGSSNPLDLGNVKGEGGGAAIVHTDTTSKWLAVLVEETSSNIIADDLGFRVTLQSPAGMDYDVYVHLGPQDGNVDCFVTPTKGTGTPESVSNSWNDDQGVFGEDDSAWLCIEVRYVSGDMCTDPWTLTVVGTG
jgi:hypothetical protein